MSVTRNRRISIGIVALAMVGSAGLVACSDEERLPADDWKRRTQDLLASLVEAADPYPVIHLPPARSSLYEQSSAIIALAQTGALDDPKASFDQFIQSALSSQDESTGLMVDEYAGKPAAASWYALRALRAVGRLDAVSTASQRLMLESASRAIVDPNHEPDPFDRVYAFRLVDFLAHEGDPGVASGARMLLESSDDDVSCSRPASASKDIDLWAMAVEMANVVGHRCSVPAPEEHELLGELRKLDALDTPSGRVDLFAVERLKSIALIGRNAATPNLSSELTPRLKALAEALAADRVEPHPVVLAVAVQLVRDTGSQAALGPGSRRQMEAVLQWGGVFSAVTRNASLFAKVARSLLLLPGRPDRDDLADLVDWNALSGLERLELAMRLNPGAIRTQDFAAAVNELDEATARKDEGDRDTPRPSGDPPRRLPMVGASYAAGVIAEAAWISDTACTGTLADFLAKRLSEIVGSQAQIASASPVLLVGAASLARYAAGCPALRQRAFEVLEAMKARGSVALAEGLRSAAANSIGPTLLRSSVELACMTGAPLDDSARATLLGFAVAHMQGAPGITETETAPTSAVSVDATIAVLEMERIGRSGCQL